MGIARHPIRRVFLLAIFFSTQQSAIPRYVTKTASLSDGARQLRSFTGGVYVETTWIASNTSRWAAEVRQLCDGSELLRMVYASDASLSDCDWTANEDDVAKFTRKFEGYVQEGDETEFNVAGLSDFQALKKDCHSFHKLSKMVPSTDDSWSHSRHRRSVLYPGTKWCGVGNAAKTYNDLGDEELTDRCCRQHDYCPLTISSLSTRFSYFNYGLSTLSHCDCEMT